MTSKIIGFKKFTSKNGNNCVVVNVTTPFTPAETSRGAYGENCQSVFLPDSCHDKITEKEIGKPCELIYDISGGRAYLNDIIIK